MVNNMIQLAATTHQAELRRAASGQQHRWADHGADTSAVSRFARALTQKLHAKAAGAAPNRTAAPRVAV